MPSKKNGSWYGTLPSPTLNPFTTRDQALNFGGARGKNVTSDLQIQVGENYLYMYISLQLLL